MNLIEFRDIAKHYGSHMIFNNLNLNVRAGTMLAITGKSGSGKTTILNMMGLLEKPDAGTVQICGKKGVRPNSQQSEKILRNHIGYLFQNYALLEEESIDHNLEIALFYNNSNRSTKQKLKQNALDAVLLSNSITQKVYELSGGEQQRVSIARLLLKPFDIVLADEPTGSLDQDNRTTIIELLKSLKSRGKTIVIATHDPYVFNQCDECIELK